MLELSIFADESGDKSDHAKYYLLTLVFHNQADSIIDQVMTERGAGPRATRSNHARLPSYGRPGKLRRH